MKPNWFIRSILMGLGMARDAGKLAISTYQAVVAKDGSGQYYSVQAAIDAVPDGNSSRYVIFIKDGIYKELVVIPSNKPLISLVGESALGTIITYDNGAGTPRPDGSGQSLGTSGSMSCLIQGTGFTAKNITFENAFAESSPYANKGRQGVAVKADADQLIFKNCRFLGHQDTLYANLGRQYYKECYIQGDVDFIFSEATAVFEGCHIHSLERPGNPIQGYITAASTKVDSIYGFIFLNCELTAATGVGEHAVYLGRPWHSGKFGKYPQGDPNVKSQSIFVRCNLGAHIHPAGWIRMATGGYYWYPETERFGEYQNFGPGATSSDSLRVQLSPEEAEKLTVTNILKGTDNWDPRTEY